MGGDVLEDLAVEFGREVRRDPPVGGRWRQAIPQLVDVDDLVVLPGLINRWGVDDPVRADLTLRALVGMAQDGDGLAVAAVLVAMRPAWRSIAAAHRVEVGEVVSIAAERLYRCDPARAHVARTWSSSVDRVLRWQREKAYRHVRREVELYEAGVDTVDDSALDGADLAVLLASLAPLDREVIVRTRLGDVAVADLAAQWGATPAAVYKRRDRAEARLAELVAA